MAVQGLELTRSGYTHRLEVAEKGISREYVWTVDGVEVARRTTKDDRVKITPQRDSRATPAHPGARGRIEVRAGLLGVTRATRIVDAVEIDMVPDPGTKAARREERIRARPRTHIVLHTTAALAKVLIPVLLASLALSWTPDIDLPTVPTPSVDLPDLPSIPWPDWDLPDIPWPNLPEWLKTIVEVVSKFVVPVALACLIAMREVRRRREQDARRAEASRTGRSTQGESRPSGQVQSGRTQVSDDGPTDVQ